MEQKAPTATQGSFSLKARRGRVVEATFVGVVGGAIVEEALQKLRGLLDTQSFNYFVIDGRGITSYDLSVRAPGRRLLQEFRDAGGKQVLFLLDSTMQRMLASTLALALNLPIRIFATEADAQAYMDAPPTD